MDCYARITVGHGSVPYWGFLKGASCLIRSMFSRNPPPAFNSSWLEFAGVLPSVCFCFRRNHCLSLSNNLFILLNSSSVQ